MKQKVVSLLVIVLLLTGLSSGLKAAFEDNNNNLKYINHAGEVFNTGLKANGPGPITDFDGDGENEILYLTDDAGQFPNYNLAYYNQNGTAINTGEYLTYVGKAGDIDGDSNLEVAGKSRYGYLRHVDYNGEGVNLSVKTDYTGAIGDFNADGTMDIVYSDDSYSPKYLQSGTLYALYQATSYSYGPYSTDIDDDDLPEWQYIDVNGNLKSIDYQNESTTMSSQQGWYVGDTDDFDFDGSLETLFGTKNDYIGYVNVDTGSFDNLSVKTYDIGGVGTFNATKVGLSWNDNSANEDGFRIYNNASGDNSFKEAKTVAANVESTVDSTSALTAGVYTCFKVVAYNKFGESDPVQKCKTL